MRYVMIITSFLFLFVIANYAPASAGTATAELKNGSAIVIHAGPDDYKTYPAGSAAPRIACGIIKK
ncbi:MAG TPA: hypothetical protein DCO77_09535 [Nitrospiraceae bacterium]|nr:hypothetical protein [Nitrospiraceae bacterium]